MSDGFERLHYLLELPLDSPGVPARREEDDELRSQPDLRGPARGLLGRRRRHGVLGAADLRAAGDAAAGAPDGEHIFGGCSRHRRSRRCARPPSCWRHASGRASYDPAVLARNAVPAAAVVYAEDVYVERAFSERTAAAVPRLRLWLTSEYDHDGLRKDGERVLGRLLDLTRGRL